MDNLPISSKYRSAPAKPVSDPEREQLVGQLNRAFSDGLVSEPDYREMLDQTFAAQTMGELAPVASRLPVRELSTSPGPLTPQGVPGEVNESRPPAQSIKLMLMIVAGAAAVLIVIAVVLGLLLT